MVTDISDHYPVSIQLPSKTKTKSKAPDNRFRHLRILDDPIAAPKFLVTLNQRIANLQAGDLNSKKENLSKLLVQCLDDVVPLKPSLSHKKVPWLDTTVKKTFNVRNKYYYQRWLKSPIQKIKKPIKEKETMQHRKYARPRKIIIVYY